MVSEEPPPPGGSSICVLGYEPPNITEGSAQGELEGVGRWELQEVEEFTRVTYDWRETSWPQR